MTGRPRTARPIWLIGWAALLACRGPVPAPGAKGGEPASVSAPVQAFSCEGDRCTQRHARMPDDGEWTCGEMAGAVICAGGERAAGVVAGPVDPAWICGERRGQAARDPLGPRICVDFAPDFPDGKMAGWRCRTINNPGGERVCERTPGVATLADACDRARPCVDGASCVSGRCVPAPPAPSCWLDSDCPGSACRFGTCRREAAR